MISVYPTPGAVISLRPVVVGAGLTSAPGGIVMVGEADQHQDASPSSVSTTGCTPAPQAAICPSMHRRTSRAALASRTASDVTSAAAISSNCRRRSACCRTSCCQSCRGETGL